MSLSQPFDSQMPSGFDVNSNRGPYLIRVTTACIILSLVAVFLRFLSRMLARLDFKADDWVTLLALPFAWTPGFQMIYASIKYGFGQHVMAVADQQKFSNFWLNLYIAEIIYPIAIVLTKVSILLFLYRVFHVRHFKFFASILGAVLITWGISTIAPAIFTCTPIPAYWSPMTYPQHTCIVTLGYFLGQVVPNLMLDVAILVLPLPWLWKLKVHRSQKVALFGVFLLGGFVTVVGALRLATIAEHQKTQDFTYDFLDLGVWTTLEMNLGIVGACLPTMGPLLRFMVRRSFLPSHSSGSGRTSGRKDGSGSYSNTSLERKRARPLHKAWLGRQDVRERLNGEEMASRWQACAWLTTDRREGGYDSPQRDEFLSRIHKATEITIQRDLHSTDDDMESGVIREGRSRLSDY